MPRSYVLLTLLLGCGGSTETASQTTPTAATSETSETATTGTTTDKRLAWEDSIACESTATSPTYTNIAESAGLLQSVEQKPLIMNGGGALGVDDLDKDGDLDLVLGFATEKPNIYWNNGDNTFTQTKLPNPASVVSVNLADINGDGYPDLLLGSAGAPGRVYVYAGNQQYDLLEMPTWSNPQNLKEFAPNDIDRDGDVDLYALTHGSGEGADMHDIILWNENGTFTADETVVHQGDGGGQGFDAGWFDYDGDGDQDIYVCNDFGADFGENILFENDNGALTRADCDCNVAHFCMGVDYADFNKDGLVDMFLTDASKHKLLQSLGDNTFVDAAPATGSDLIDNAPEMAWGAVFLDWNNDGDQDLLLAMGLARVNDGTWDKTPGEGVALLDQADGTFSNVAPSLGLEQTDNYRSTVAADFNNDGVEDLVITEILKAPLLYLSDSCTKNGWITVNAPTGSRVEIRSGGITQVDWVSQESSQGAAQPARVHFGLGEETTISYLKVTIPEWSSGVASTQMIELLHQGSIEAQRVVTAAL
jgi:hypothetical protein